jgi:hypothetical protein
MEQPSEALRARVQAMLAPRRLVAWRSINRGYTPAERWVVSLDDSSSCFLKAGVDTMTAGWLRDEHSLYSRLDAPFLPRLIAWDDDGGVAPILALEDLSDAVWPPPWTDERVRLVSETLAAVRATPAGGLPSIRVYTRSHLTEGWLTVRQDPGPFLSLGLCTESWLKRAGVTLDARSRGVQLGGGDLVHLDIRSDNLCFAGERVVIVDWNHACRGNGLVDVAFWLPSLHAEGGPQPEAVLPDAPGWAALVSGFFAARAGLPVIPKAPGVRDVQLQQLRAALPWAVRALGLPPLDGPNAPD